MKFQENSTPIVLPSPNFTVVGTGEQYVANPNGQLIAVPENVARALNNTQGMDSSNTQNPLNLSSEQIKALSNEIEQKLPFGSALMPVLTALGFTDVSKNEKNGKLTLGVNEYEVFKTKAQKGPNEGKEVQVIRMPNHILESEKTDMANKAMVAIRSLFPERTINFTLKALNDSADEHGIFPGFRSGGDGLSDYVDYVICSWVGGDGDAVDAPCAGRNRYGYSYSDKVNRLNALCLVASFG